MTPPTSSPPFSEPVPRVLAELGSIIYAENDLQAVLSRVTELAQQTLPRASSVSITLVEGGHATTAAHSSELALALDERQYSAGYGPCLEAAASLEHIYVADLRQETRWPDYVEQALTLGGRSSLSMPLSLADASLGAMNAYASEPDGFDIDAVALMSTFAGYAAVALTNAGLYARTARLADDMRSALTSRAVIDQAKGVIIALHGGSADEAFSRIVRESQRRNVKVRLLADEIVERASQRSSAED